MEAQEKKERMESLVNLWVLIIFRRDIFDYSFYKLHL